MYIVLNKQNSIEIFSFDLNFFTECSPGTIIPKYLHWKEGNHMFMYLNMQAFKKKFVMHEYEKYIHVKLKIPQKYHVLLSFFFVTQVSPSQKYPQFTMKNIIMISESLDISLFWFFKFSTEVNVGLFFINVCINRQFTFHSS